MDPIDVLILVLRLVLVTLLYVFLVAVLRQAAAGLREPAAERLKLVVVEPGGSDLAAGQVVDIATGSTLGRAQRANVVVADPSVSGEHARLERVGRSWVVTDLGSTNGTRVNQTRVGSKTPIADGDVLALGAVQLRVMASG
jgi:predicted component of type VI protein secretion system